MMIRTYFNMLNKFLVNLTDFSFLLKRRLELFIEDAWFIDFLQKQMLFKTWFTYTDTLSLNYSNPIIYSYLLNLFNEVFYFSNSLYWWVIPGHTNTVYYIVLLLLVNLVGMVLFSFLCLWVI